MARQEQTAENKGARVSTGRLYFATLGFVIRRVKDYLFAVLFFFLYWILLGSLELFFPQIMEKLSWLVTLVNTFLLVFLFSQIASWNKRKFLLGQIGVITSSLLTGTLPEKPFKTGLAIAQERFHGVGAFMILKDGVRLLYRTARKSTRRKGELMTQLLLLLQNLVSLVVLIFAGLFTQLGACLIAYAYRFPGSRVDFRHGLNAGRHYFKHFGGVIGEFLLSLLIWIGVTAAAALPATVGLFGLLDGLLTEGLCGSILTELFPGADEKRLGLIVFLILLAFLTLLLTMFITGPLEKIRTVRRYLVWLDRDGADTEEDLGADLIRLREKLRSRGIRCGKAEEDVRPDSGAENDAGTESTRESE